MYKNTRVSYENDLVTREEERSAMLLLQASELEHILALFHFDSALSELEYLIGKDLGQE